MMATNVVTSPMKTEVSIIPIRDNEPFGAGPLYGNLASETTKMVVEVDDWLLSVSERSSWMTKHQRASAFPTC
jgi:hypothetical protein